MSGKGSWPSTCIYDSSKFHVSGGDEDTGAWASLTCCKGCIGMRIVLWGLSLTKARVKGLSIVFPSVSCLLTASVALLRVSNCRFETGVSAKFALFKSLGTMSKTPTVSIALFGVRATFESKPRTFHRGSDGYSRSDRMVVRILKTCCDTPLVWTSTAMAE